MKHSIALKAVATSAGGFYYREEHEWRNIDDAGLGFLVGKVQDLGTLADQLEANKSVDDDPITAVLSAAIDGQDVPERTYQRISRADMVKFQRAAHKIGDELLDMGEQKAKRGKP